MKKIVCLLLIVLSLNVFSQDKKLSDYIKISTELINNSELDTLLFRPETNNANELFIRNIEEYVKDQDTVIVLQIGNDKIVTFCWFKYIFFYNISFWLEFKKFEIINNKSTVEFETISVYDPPKIPFSVSGKATFIEKDGIWEEESFSFKIKKLHK